jgi:hypothetical protein
MTEPAGTTYTNRLGMRVPGMDDELDALRPNWDRLDNTMAGAIWVADGVTPENNLLFEGALVAEVSSGKVWRAARNQSGVYEKKWIKYPWNIVARATTPQAFGSGQQDGQWGYDFVEDKFCVNAGLSDIVGTRIKLPIAGIYQGVLTCRWEYTNNNNNGMRRICICYDGATDINNTEIIQYPSSFGGAATTTARFIRKFDAGENICASIWQTSGVALMMTNVIQVQLVRAL